MKRKREYVYNEHDENQVQEILRKRKKRKRKLKIRRIIVLFILFLIVAFFVSDFSKIQSITVSGTNLINQEDVINNLSVKKKKSFTLFTSTSSVKNEVSKMNFVDSVKVTKSLFGEIKIVIVEAKPIAYSVIDNVLYIVDQHGELMVDKEQKWLSYVQRCTKLNGFDLDNLKKFSKEYAKVSSVVQNKVSDVNFAASEGDIDRCEFLLDDNKVFYVRYSEIAESLTAKNYAKAMADCPDFKYYNFYGTHVYANN